MSQKSKIAAELELLNGQYLAKLKQSQDKTKGFAQNTQKSFMSIKSSMVASGLALSGIVYGFSKLTNVTNEQIAVEKKLDAVLKSTRQAAGLSAEEIKNMASGLQDVTTFGDETILSGQNLLLTFTKIGKDVFPQATETMLNMSVALKQDLKQSAIQLGKALNDPILGITALRRVGVQLSDSQEQQIRSFVKVNDIASAQKVILGELETQFGGVARAMTETPTGNLTQLKNVIGDLAEDVGKEFVSSLRLLTDTLLVSAKGSGALSTGLESIGKAISAILKGYSFMINTLDLVSIKFGDHDDKVKATQLVYNDTLSASKNLMKQLQDEYGAGWMKLAEAQADSRFKDYENLKKAQITLSEKLIVLQESQADTIMRMAEAVTDEAIIYQENLDEKVNATTEFQAQLAQMRVDEDALEAARQSDRAAKEKTRKDKILADEKAIFDQRKLLLQKYHDFNYTLLDLKLIKENQTELEAANHFKEVLQTKLRLNSKYASGIMELGNFANVYMSQENAKLFRIGQGLAISQAIVNTALAVTKVLSQLGIFGPVASAAVIGAGALQIRQIANQSPPAPPTPTVKTLPVPELAEGGIIPGSRYGTHIVAGEGGKSEAIVPLDGRFGNITINVEGSVIDAEGLLDLVDQVRENRATMFNAQNYFSERI